MASVTLVKIKRVLRERGLLATVSRGFARLGEYRRTSRRVKFVPRATTGQELVDFIFSHDARFIQPLQIPAEIGSLLDLLIPMNLTNVLEIGTATGGTLFLWTRVASEDATIVSVDLPGGEFGEGYPRWAMPLYRSFAMPGQRLELVRASSHSPDTLQQIRQLFSNRRLDFLFIDADHTYEGVKQDFEMYRKLVKPGGVIGFHDINPPRDDDYGVPRFWNEIKEQFRHSEFVQGSPFGCGIGVLFV